MGGHSSPADAEEWYTTAGPAWIVLAKVFWVVFFLQPLILGSIRLAILFLYRRFFQQYRTFNIINWVMIGIVTGWTISFFFGLLFDCGLNFSANWGSLSEIAEQCPFGFLPTIIYTILDACLDLFVLVLPIPWVSISLPYTYHPRKATDSRLSRSFNSTSPSQINSPSSAALCSAPSPPRLPSSA